LIRSLIFEARVAAKRLLNGAPSSRKIFVLGTGRSGTHWLGYILGAHPDIHATIEKPPIFPWVTRMALDPRTRTDLLPKLLRRYDQEHILVAPKHYADKSHPTIWIAEELARAFPEARFVGIVRGPYGTVASMLQHDGVMRWIHRWRDFPVPNRFLGITEAIAPTYDSMPLAGRCALRWRSHRDRMAALESTLGERMCVLSYEELQTDTVSQLEAVARFLGLASPIPVPQVRRESLDRWREQLDADAIAAIDAVLDAKAA
jgi:hypothetical protein